MLIRSLLCAQPEGVSHDATILKRVLLKNGEVPCLTNFSQAVLEAGEVTTSHRHADMWEVFYVDSGEGFAIIDERRVDLSRGYCLVVAPGEKHQIGASAQVPLTLNYFGIAPGVIANALKV